MAHWIWETGHHGNGLSLQVVCNGMRSLWAQFVCLHVCMCLCIAYLSFSFSSIFHSDVLCKKQKDREDCFGSFGMVVKSLTLVRVCVWGRERELNVVICPAPCSLINSMPSHSRAWGGRRRKGGRKKWSGNKMIEWRKVNKGGET